MPTRLCVRADATAILRNILNYFSDNLACIQELLQNARRAEASEVRVEIDSQADTVTVTDNGHGVINPEDLLNIGKSEWSEGVKAERPAGMGLFSVFKLGGLAAVRSGRWILMMTYDALCAGLPAYFKGKLPAVKGTQIKISRLHHPFGSHGMPHPTVYAERWAREARFMPFRTTIVVDGNTRVIEPHNPHRVPAGALRASTPWGFVDLHTQPQAGEYQPETLLIQQGVAIRLKGLSSAPDGPWVHIHARPGTVNFTLPDRDAVLEDDQYRNVVDQTRQACVETVITRICEFGDGMARRRLAALVYAWGLSRVIELPEDLLQLRVHRDHEHLCTMTRRQVAERLAKGALTCDFTPSYDTAFELVPNEMLWLASGQISLFRAMFPKVPVVTGIQFTVAEDERSDLLWRCTGVSYRFDSGESRDVTPEPERVVLADGDIENEFRLEDYDRAGSREATDLAVVHTCAGAVTCPNLEPWFLNHDENMDRDQAEELWRTSDYARAIAATWPGVPANDVTPDELVLLLRDRFAGGNDCRLRFANAEFEPVWGNRLNIRSMTLEIVEAGTVARRVRLSEHDGYLQETRP